MTWHTDTVAPDQVSDLVAKVRHQGGIVTSCRRCAQGVCVVWTTC